MEQIDDFINNVIGTKSNVTTGVSTVVLSLFTSKLFPKVPPKFYKLLDNDIVRISIVSFLINKELKKPTQSLMIGSFVVLTIHLLVKIFAPDSPPLSELVKPETESENKTGKGTCNCYCGGPIYTGAPPPKDKTVEKQKITPIWEGI